MRRDDELQNPKRTTRDGRGLLAAILVVVGVWCVLYLRRRAAHQPNVDDYFYASVARTIYHAFASNPIKGISAVMHTGQTAPLVPLLAAPLQRIGGVEGAVAVNLLFVIAHTVGAYLLARRWVDRSAAAVIAMIATLNPAVMAWSQMLNFAVAASALSLLALASYLHSDRFRRWRWSVATGVAVGLLSLSRSLAPVYVVPLIVAIGAPVFTARGRREFRQSLPQVSVAAGTALAIAAPWWITSGREAFRYLRSAGYSASSDFNTGRPGIVDGVTNRARETLSDLGSGAQDALLVLAAVALVLLVVRRRLGSDAMTVAGWSAGCFAVLASVSTGGTGFGLPLVAVLIIAVAVTLSRLPTRARLGTLAVVALISGVGLVGRAGDSVGTAFPGAVYRLHVSSTGALANTNVDAVHKRVAAQLGSDPLLLVRDDNVLNGNGLRWIAAGRLRLIDLPFGPTATVEAISKLPTARYLITGVTNGSYHRSLDQEAVEAAARQQGFVVLFTWTLGPDNTVRLWRRS